MHFCLCFCLWCKGSSLFRNSFPSLRTFFVGFQCKGNNPFRNLLPFFSVSVEREPGEQSQQDCFSFEIIVKRTVTAVSIKHPVVLKVSMSFSSSLFPIYYCHCWYYFCLLSDELMLNLQRLGRCVGRTETCDKLAFLGNAWKEQTFSKHILYPNAGLSHIGKKNRSK